MFRWTFPSRRLGDGERTEILSQQSSAVKGCRRARNTRPQPLASAKALAIFTRQAQSQYALDPQELRDTFGRHDRDLPIWLGMHNRSMTRFTALEVRWKTALKNNSSASSAIEPAVITGGPTSSGCCSPVAPTFYWKRCAGLASNPRNWLVLKLAPSGSSCLRSAR